MDRFLEPQENEEPDILGQCEHCNEDLQEGSEIFESDEGTFCSLECVMEHYGITEKVLEKEN